MNRKHPCVLILLGLMTLAVAGNVRADLINVAYNTAATESSDPYGFPASLAVDGNDSTFQHTGLGGGQWWKTHFGAIYRIDSITVVPRPGFTDRINGAVLTLAVEGTPFAVILNTDGTNMTYTMPPNTYAESVQIKFPDSMVQFLNFNEIYVYSDGTTGAPYNGTNLALGGVASQSTTLDNNPANWGAAFAIDGHTDGTGAGSVSQTANPTNGQWWLVDLGTRLPTIDRIVLWNRISVPDDMARLSDLNVQVMDLDGITIGYDYYLAHTNTYLNPSNVLGGPLLIVVDLTGSNIRGRYVKVTRNTNPSTNDYFLALAEVQVFGVSSHTLTNLAPAGVASQSTTLNDDTASWGAAIAIDGITYGTGAGTVTHTAAPSNGQWWQLVLGSRLPMIEQIILWNRNSVPENMARLSDLNVQVLGANGTTVVYDYYIAHTNTYLNPGNVLGGPVTLQIGPSVRGQYVKVIRYTTGACYLSMAEVQVYGYQPPSEGIIFTLK